MTEKPSNVTGSIVRLDGSFGEGGGQILRTALSLSMVTGRPCEIHSIRAGRPKPGLMRQHHTAVKAAAEVCGARVTGAAVGSTQVRFEPGATQPGDYAFSIGTAGSTTLVLQTILPALMLADRPSTVVIEGGTHNIHAPSLEFLDRSFLPVLARMGPRVDVSLERHGFYPAGGGRVRAAITPVAADAPASPDAADARAATAPLAPLELMERGEARGCHAIAAVAGLSGAIAKRELAVIEEQLGWTEAERSIVQLDDAEGPGNVLSLVIEFEHVTEVITGFGERGVLAERVATDAATAAKTYLRGTHPVGPFLADQLMLPLALAGGGRYVTGPLTRHAKTNAHVIEQFLDVSIDCEGRGETTVVEIGPSRRG